jgi:hypothetical protein
LTPVKGGFASGDGKLRSVIAICFEHDLFDHALTATVRLATPDERAPLTRGRFCFNLHL